MQAGYLFEMHDPFHLFIYLFIYLFVYLSIYLFIYDPFHLFK